MKSNPPIKKDMQMKKIFSLILRIFSYSFFFLFIFLIAFHHYFYNPAFESYEKIAESLTKTIFNIASINLSCEGMKKLANGQTHKLPYYKQDLISDHQKLLDSQTNLNLAIIQAQPNLDAATINKIIDFLKWTQNQEYNRVTTGTCPQIDTSFESLMALRDNLTKKIPFSFTDYCIFRIKSWFKSLTK